MITSPQEYEVLLSKIQDKNEYRQASLTPNDERIYKIDLNSRKIEAPEFLSVEHEHVAETIYFVVDRFYDSMDLANTTCIIQYVNANNDTFIYAVPFLDTITIQDKIIIPWCISGAATAYPGKITFVVRFYQVDLDCFWDPVLQEYVYSPDKELIFKYNLSTLPAESKVLYGMNAEYLAEEYDIAADIVNGIFQRIDEVAKGSTLYWIDV